LPTLYRVLLTYYLGSAKCIDVYTFLGKLALGA